MPCRCDNNACSTCACAKANILCTLDCHGKRDWDDIPCLNTTEGKQVKAMKIKDVRTALCGNNLSPVGDKQELLKRLADFFRKQGGKGESKVKKDDDVSGVQSSSQSPNKELFNAIINNEDDYKFILSLSGKTILDTSSKAEMRRSYLLLSSKVHPDKNSGSHDSVKAFQILLGAYERLANPEKFLEDEDDTPAKKRQKTERFTRSNERCFKTKIKCPQCNQTWGGADLGLEDAAYNFFMMGIKQYYCGRCSCQFGCMTGLHFCPGCNKEFAYDPDDYHRIISCGNDKCRKEFGFWMFKVSERREREVRKEAKELHEQRMKRNAQKNRRAKRAGNRVADLDSDSTMRLQEQLFLILLRDECPRCGWQLPRGEGTEEAREHLDSCDNKEEIKMYQQHLAKEKAEALAKEKSKASQEEMMAFKQWELNGRQVGQLWMLSDDMLKKQCTSFNLEAKGVRHELIGRLAKYLRSNERLMITDGKTKVGGNEYDTCGVVHADEEDLPQNIHGLEREELQDLCASYNIKFNPKKDAKTDLIKKFEKARFKGNEQLMLCSKGESDDD